MCDKVSGTVFFRAQSLIKSLLILKGRGQLLVSETLNVHVCFMATFVGIVVVPKLPVTAFLLSCLFLVMLITFKKSCCVEAVLSSSSLLLLCQGCAPS